MQSLTTQHSPTSKMLPVQGASCVPNFCCQLIYIFVLFSAFFSEYTLLNPLWTRTYYFSDDYFSKMNEHSEAFALWDVNVTSRVNLDRWRWDCHFVLKRWSSTTNLCHVTSQKSKCLNNTVAEAW